MPIISIQREVLMKHILKSIVICIVIAAVIGYFFYTPDYYDKDGNLRYSREKGIGGSLAFAGFGLLLYSIANISVVSAALHSSTVSAVAKKDANVTPFMQGGQAPQILSNTDYKPDMSLFSKNLTPKLKPFAISIPFILTFLLFLASGYFMSMSNYMKFR